MSRRRELILVVSVFTALTLALTYPQIRLLSTHMGSHPDTLFSVWRLAWFAHQLPRDPAHLFDGNIFFPERHTLAYSDALLLQSALAAPIIWIGGSPVLAHNILVLISFVLCAVSMYALAKQLTESTAAAWFAGAVFAFQPYRFDHYSQLELLWGWPIPLAFLMLHRLVERGRTRDALVLGLIVAVQAWSCLYYAVFLMTALALLALALLVGRVRAVASSLIKPALVAAAVLAVSAGLYAIPYLGSGSTVGLRRESDVWNWSPSLLNYLATPRTNLLYGRLTDGFGRLEAVLFPGLTAVVLALVGIIGRVDRRRLAYFMLLVIAFDLSLGFRGFLYRPLYEFVWIYRGLRVPARMFVVVSAALSVLGAYGVARVLSTIKRRSTQIAAAIGMVALVLLESASTPIDLSPVAEPPPVYQWIRRLPPGAVMEWPLPRASQLGITHAPLYMYYSTFHWHDLVNGYSGFYPPSYIELVETVQTLPSRAAVDIMRRRLVQYLVVHSEFEPRFDELMTALRASDDFELLAVTPEGNGMAALYRLR